MSGRLLGGLSMASLLAALAVGGRLDAPSVRRHSHILYVPPGPYLVATASGFRSVLADSLYLWAIQYVADETIKGQDLYLPAVFDAITDLDPRFDDAYFTGAFLLATDGGDTRAALRLLDKGHAVRRTFAFPYDAGFYAFMYLKDYELAASYFSRASEHPDCPVYVRRLALKMVSLESPREAYDLYAQELRDFQAKHAPEEIERDIQKVRHVRLLRVRLAELETSLEAAALQEILAEMTAATDVPARTLVELRSFCERSGRTVPALPGGGDPWVDPFGVPYVIEAGSVLTSAAAKQRLESGS